MAYPMGGAKWKTDKSFEEFKSLCVQAYLSIAVMLCLLEGIIPAKMPQLKEVKDLDYVRDKLCLELTVKMAAKSFRAEIARSLGTMWRRFDDFIHDNVHFGK
eukprot:CAMPEP_0167784878 /NCGR_PEP_ID=MMETSP0111_2-20121227/7925_1 /TAXON_ID=91324 /ORGANISM="Lotharella globosa, Strain CCCM811" /LENGTH=101 /DNA_ID=CAMNT_0007676085 /DNA_START=24 /DNA_END=330 /DNA_ORIENTATION=-